jgi:hypothetical protein
MSKRTLGILATVVGSAFGAWWFTSQQRLRLRSRTASALPSGRDHGTVIFDNTPVASDVDAII